MAQTPGDIDSVIETARDLADDGEFRHAISTLTRANLAARDIRLETEIRRLRYERGIALVTAGTPRPEFVAPGTSPDASSTGNLPEIERDALTPALLRAAILEAGGLLVRGLIDEPEAAEVAAGIDRAFAAREIALEGGDSGGFFDNLPMEESFGVAGSERAWVRSGGGLLASDSPPLLFQVLELFERAGLPDVVAGYLGEEPALAAQKFTLRCAQPEVGGAWHQDGRFLGDVRSLNVWLALSSCGVDAPSLDVVPRRQETLLETAISIQVEEKGVLEAGRGAGILRALFEPGDAIIFDELFLHKTGADPDMIRPRYSIESWFFGPSAFPETYAPLAF